MATAAESYIAEVNEMPPHRSRRTKVFISYSHKDTSWLERLQVHLKPLGRDLGADIWDDTRIQSGAKWREEIERALESAAVAILLVSADFLASDFIAGNELPPLLKAAEEDGTLILPIILSPSGFRRHEALSQFQAFNDPANPLVNMQRGRQEAVFERVAERVAALLSTLASATQSEAKLGRARMAKQTTGRKRPLGLRANVAQFQKAGGAMSNDSPTPEDASNEEQLSAKKRRRMVYRLVIAVVGLGALTVFIMIAIQHSGDRAQGIISTQEPGHARSDTLSPQSSPDQPQQDVVRVTIENGGTASIFNDRLVIHLDGIRFDEGSNQYLVSFSLSSTGAKELNAYDVKVSDEEQLTYPANGKLKIQMLSAEANFADFAIEKTKN